MHHYIDWKYTSRVFNIVDKMIKEKYGENTKGGSLMNILHITTFLQGGAGRIIYDLAKAQNRDGNAVVVVTSETLEPGYENYEEYIVGLKHEGIPTYQIDSSFKRDLYLNLKMVEQVREIIKLYDIDIIHAHAAIPALIGLIARQISNKYIPIVQTMHGYGLNKNLFQQEMDRIIMNGIDPVVAVSEDSKRILIEKGVEQNRIQVIYNGIVEQYAPELEGDKELDLQEVIEWKNSNHMIFGCIGTVCEMKNQAFLLEAIKLVNNDIPNIRFVFIGEGDLLDKLRDLTVKYELQDKVRFYGYKQNANEYLKYFDCLILPSKSEGFGMVIVEAFKEKVPVIASDIDVFRELIINEKTGILFDLGDVKNLVKAIKKIVSIPPEVKKLMTQQAYEVYKRKFTFDIMKRKYDDLYISLQHKSH